MRSLLCLLAVAAWARAAHAGGGFELDEQSAAGVGMAGAHTAVANDPAAVYYNPAGLAFQPGFGALVGGNLIVARTHVSPDNLTLWYPAVAPTVFIGQRFGRYVALGMGVFTNFGEHFNYPENWRGRFEGFFIDITTVTFQPTLAFRPASWLSLGVGLDVMIGSFDLYRALEFGGSEGSVHAGATATGLGGNVGLLVKLVPRYLNLGFSYRSRIDLDFTGLGAVTAPPELQSMAGGVQNAKLSLPLPHNFSVGTAAFIGHLILSSQLNVTLWRDLQQLTLTLTDPQSGSASSTVLPLNYHNTWSIRAGAQYSLAHDRVRLRLGGGYDSTPVPTSTLGPLAPDANRALVSAGIGVHFSVISLDVGYMAVFLLKTTSTNRDFVATYESFGQVISASATLQLERVLQGHRYFNHTEE